MTISFESAMDLALIVLKVVVPVVLLYVGLAIRKPFPIILGIALSLIAGQHFLSLALPHGRETDLLMSLASSLVFGFAVMSVLGMSQPINFALVAAIVGTSVGAMAGVHAAFKHFQNFDVATSVLVVSMLGIIVAIQSARNRPVLSGFTAVVTIGYAALQMMYFWDTTFGYYHETLGFTTIAYAVLVVITYCLPDIRETPPWAFRPRAVGRKIRRSIGRGTGVRRAVAAGG